MYATGSDQVLRELEESAGGNTTASTEVQSNCTLTKLATPQGARLGLPCLHGGSASAVAAARSVHLAC